MRIASSDGVELVVHDLGGDGPLLLISHATGFCGAMYQVVADRLKDRYHVLAVDYRGHGDSTTPEDGNLGWDGMARDLGHVLDALAPGAPIVGFGHSMGGAVLLLVAAQRPTAFSHLYLYEPIVPPAAMPEGATDVAGNNMMASSARRRRPSFPSKAEALWRYASPRSPLSVFRSDALLAYVDHGMASQADGSATLKCTPENEARTFEGAGRHIHVDVIRGITVPTMVARGAQEIHLPPGQFAPVAAAALPASEFVEYPTLGHFGPFQDPVLVAADVLRFVATH